MIPFQFIQLFLAAGWFFVKMIPDAVNMPANVVPEAVRLVGVFVELDVAFPVSELLGMFGLTTGVYLLFAPLRFAEYIWARVPGIGGGE